MNIAWIMTMIRNMMRFTITNNMKVITTMKVIMIMTVMTLMKVITIIIMVIIGSMNVSMILS